ncbi:putative dual specificity protein phosphatase DSP8 [Capsicum annuum]|uniref:phosphatidylglycerophosphate phosphatase PTPMT1 n=1 Tax=Capsicum annuum TaxID=4072 RepID=UPI0007BEABFB|nr:phosphatidylglycerophosphate phosphatase PTPMT1 [Capsicum annuum]KAF3645879.1 putative dual specificity protein phosphatase DSP8 [Capsicum annuum]KAF3654213.1 putative dual specificity protein phosphatase DSP8 [Capsicum annuum]
MYIEEEKGGEVESGEEEVVVGGGVVEKVEKLDTGGEVLCSSDSSGKNSVVVLDVRRVMVGVGARALFYPTLLYNVVRNKIQMEFRWWDWIDEFVLLGAVPFQSDVKRLKELGVSGVVTLNEPYETLVPTSLYEAHGICHLVLPTRDYLFAPSLNNICQAVEFIHENASNGQSTYVHCKAGRGRSTTIVLCYLVKYKQMTPNDAYNYVKSIRPRVLLASAQRQAVQEFYHLMVKKTYSCYPLTSVIPRSSRFLARRNLLAFDDGAVVVITEADLDGYDSNLDSRVAGSEIWADLNLIYRVRVASGAALARLSCMWLRCHADQKIPNQKLNAENKQLESFTVDIHVFSS